MRVLLPIFLVILLIPSGCVIEEEAETPSTGTIVSALEADDEFTTNRIILNRIILNRIILNRLSSDSLSADSLYGLETTEEGRELLAYVVICALDEGQIFSVTHEAQTYIFPGSLGVAPAWPDRALTLSERRWISACLLGHVNAYGLPVEASMRSLAPIDASPEEMALFPVYEATFFGDVFAPDDPPAQTATGATATNTASTTLPAFACLGSDAAISTAHAPSRALRVCADPTPDCEMEALGYCRDVCERYVDGLGWTDCWANGVRYAETVSTFLRAEGDLCQASCASDASCQLRCAHDDPLCPDSDGFTGGRIFDCNNTAGICDASCRYGTCSVDGIHTEVVAVTARSGTQAEIGCTGAGVCHIDCSGTGTDCQVDCTDTEDCEISWCDFGATCLVDCSGAESCSIEVCTGEQKQCADGVTVCNRDCP